MRTALLSFVAALVAAPAASYAGDAVRHVTLSTQLHSRTSLHVSSHLLVFEAGADGEAVSTAIDYTAAARTHVDAEVVLSVASARIANGPGGASDVETELFLSVQDGASLRVSGEPVTAARWIGSGARAGRLTFTLRAAAAGTYVVPVRVVLVVP